MFKNLILKGIWSSITNAADFIIGFFVPKGKNVKDSMIEILVSVILAVCLLVLCWVFVAKVFTSIKDSIFGETKQDLAKKVVVQQNEIDRLKDLINQNQKTLEQIQATTQLALDAVKKQQVVEKEIRTHTETVIYQHASSVADIKNDTSIPDAEKIERISAVNIDAVITSFNDYNNASSVAKGEKK